MRIYGETCLVEALPEIGPFASHDRGGLLDVAIASQLTANNFTTRDGTIIYYKDWGKGPVVVFSHGYPLSSDFWEDQMLFLSQRGFRVIAHDRRGFGRSSQPGGGYDMDTFADDLGALIKALDVANVTLVGHCMGGGEVVRYLGRHGQRRIGKVVLVSAVPPVMVKSAANPSGVPVEVFDGMRAAVQADRSQFFMDVTRPYFNDDGPGTIVSPGLHSSFWRQGMATGMLAAYHAIRAFSETDFTADLKTIRVPTLIVHGTADQIVPVDSSGRRSAGIVKEARLLTYENASHGLPATHKDRLNADLLDFLRSRPARH